MSGTIDGNLIVEDGGTAVLFSALVKGNVEVKPGGDLLFSDGSTSTIEGNVQAEGARRVQLVKAVVFGDVQVKNTTGGLVAIIDSLVGGNVQLEER